jgi:hypothetical protein
VNLLLARERARAQKSNANLCQTKRKRDRRANGTHANALVHFRWRSSFPPNGAQRGPETFTHANALTITNARSRTLTRAFQTSAHVQGHVRAAAKDAATPGPHALRAELTGGEQLARAARRRNAAGAR